MSHCTRGTWQGYYNALERTFFVDHVDAASLKYWEVNCAVHRRGLELIRWRGINRAAEQTKLYNHREGPY